MGAAFDPVFPYISIKPYVVIPHRTDHNKCDKLHQKWRGFLYKYNSYLRELLVGQWAMHWPAKLAVRVWILQKARLFLTINRIPFHTAFHHPPLTLTALIMTAADDIHKYFSLFFRENKTWCFMWILCQAEDSHETSSLIFFERWK